jgi:superfamily II DNA or RNA helicase
MKYQKREYQQRAISAALKGLFNNSSKDLIVIPTGGGKTLILTEIAEHAVNHDLKVLIITPRRELLDQISKSVGKIQSISHGIMSGQIGYDTGEDHQAIVATSQTLIRRNNLVEPDLIIVDEAHLLPPNSKTTEILHRFPKAKVIGLNAPTTVFP